jgi:hypothetical protein
VLTVDVGVYYILKPPPPFRKAENLTVLEKLPTYQYLASVCQLTEAGGVGSVALDVRYCVTVVHAHETAKKKSKNVLYKCVNLHASQGPDS